MVGARSSPNRARVIQMSSLVTLISERRLYKPMSCAHQLSIFNHHFATMSVTMILSSMFRVGIKIEDVHFLALNNVGESCREAI